MRLAPSLVTATTDALIEEAVTIEEARKACHVEHTEDDAEIKGYVRTAFEWLQPPSGWLGRSVLTQTLRLDLAGWHLTPLDLPAAPVASISSIKYFDTDNAEQTLDSGAYFLDGATVLWTASFNEPAVYDRPSAVRITYVAGYAADALPRPIKQGILQLTAHLYQHRGDAPEEMPPTVQALLMPFRLWA